MPRLERVCRALIVRRNGTTGPDPDGGYRRQFHPCPSVKRTRLKGSQFKRDPKHLMSRQSGTLADPGRRVVRLLQGRGAPGHAVAGVATLEVVKLTGLLGTLAC